MVRSVSSSLCSSLAAVTLPHSTLSLVPLLCRRNALAHSLENESQNEGENVNDFTERCVGSVLCRYRFYAVFLPENVHQEMEQTPR